MVSDNCGRDKTLKGEVVSVKETFLTLEYLFPCFLPSENQNGTKPIHKALQHFKSVKRAKSETFDIVKRYTKCLYHERYRCQPEYAKCFISFTSPKISTLHSSILVASFSATK